MNPAASVGRRTLASVSNSNTSDWRLWIVEAVPLLFGLYVACCNCAAIFFSIRNQR